MKQPVWRHNLLWRQSWLTFSSCCSPGLCGLDKVIPDRIQIQSFVSVQIWSFFSDVNCDVILVASKKANFQELIRAYETGRGRGWYRENVSSKWNLKVVLRFKIHSFHGNLFSFSRLGKSYFCKKKQKSWESRGICKHCDFYHQMHKMHRPMLCTVAWFFIYQYYVQAVLLGLGFS